MTPLADAEFRRLFEAAPGLLLVLRPDLAIAAVTDGYLAATMTRREAILGRHLFDVFPDNPDDPEATGVSNLRASLGRVIAHRRPDAMAVQKYDIRRPESEGGAFEERHWSPVNHPVLGDDGTLRYIIHRVEDVTEFVRLRRDADARVRHTAALEERARHMESEIFDRAQELQAANRQLRSLQGELERRVTERTAELDARNRELRREMEEHEKTTAALRSSEQQLVQAQKLEAVGRLASGIAHDFNNLLSVILSYSEIILEEACPGDRIAEDVESIRKAGQRAAALTRELLAFSRQQVLAPRVVDLNEVVRGSERILRRVIGEDIEFVISCADDLSPVKVDPGQMDQVIMNLVVNARDAMPRGGTLAIETRNVLLDEDYAAEHVDCVAGPHVMLAVTDTGAGMDQATQARIFEPFFTTKEQGKGTGLGLSTVFGIVKQSGGSIWVYSEPGLGTTFKVYLPVSADRTPTADVPRPVVDLRGSETVLLVEDQDDVRRVAREVLRRYGYQVLEASSGVEALHHAEQPAGAIHLLLTDVVMPKVSGPELAARLLALRPGLRVLYMSGYTDSSVFHTGLLDASAEYLQKPLAPEALARRVREVLDAPR